LTVLRKGYGKIVQVMRPGNPEKNRKKEETEAVSDRKKPTNPQKKAGAEKPWALSESL
jgi:hypothetical protein